MSDIEKAFDELWIEISTYMKGELGSQNQKTVEEFLKNVRQSINFEMLSLAPNNPITPEVRGLIEQGLRGLKELVNPINCGQITSISLETVREEIKAQQNMLDIADSLKLTSRAAEINEFHILALVALRNIFRKHFPDQSDRYIKGNLLYEIGCSLTRKKSLPKNLHDLTDNYFRKTIERMEKNGDIEHINFFKNPSSIENLQVSDIQITKPKKRPI